MDPFLLSILCCFNFSISRMPWGHDRPRGSKLLTVYEHYITFVWTVDLILWAGLFILPRKKRKTSSTSLSFCLDPIFLCRVGQPTSAIFKIWMPSNRFNPLIRWSLEWLWWWRIPQTVILITHAKRSRGICLHRKIYGWSKKNYLYLLAWRSNWLCNVGFLIAKIPIIRIGWKEYVWIFFRIFPEPW
jgi:hypothetical protein